MAYKSFFNWSGGKDSALALYHILQDKNYSVEKLVTNISSQYRRVSMHGVREALAEQQATSIGIPLQKSMLPDQPTMLAYEQQQLTILQQLQAEGFTHNISGDIFLEDLKTYREAQLAKMQMTAVFPLWKRDTAGLMQEFISLGFKAVAVCVNAGLLHKSFAGRLLDQDFISQLPGNVDLCGENGEFHTFVFDGPIFKSPVAFKTGEHFYHDYKAPVQSALNDPDQKATPANMGFWFCDLLPG